jgi:hypothetical protein
LTADPLAEAWAYVELCTAKGDVPTVEKLTIKLIVHRDTLYACAFLNADRGVVEQAAAHLRHQAILAAYAGLEHKHLAFGLALILDEIARHFRDLDEQLRDRILDCCRSVLGHSGSGV